MLTIACATVESVWVVELVGVESSLWYLRQDVSWIF